MHEVERLAIEAARESVAFDNGHVREAKMCYLGSGHPGKPALTLESHDLACWPDGVRKQRENPDRTAAHVEHPRSLPNAHGLKQRPGGGLVLVGLRAKPRAFRIGAAEDVLSRAPGIHTSGPLALNRTSVRRPTGATLGEITNMAVDDVFMDTMSAMVTGKFSKPRTRRRARRRPTRRSR
jgi:hypothetical protein